MRICVENGMFTVSFLKEGITKVNCPKFPSLFTLGTKMTRPPSSVAGLMTCSRLLGRLVEGQTC
jgi:hypothetical protein